jgi:hypothetical protein
LGHTEVHAAYRRIFFYALLLGLWLEERLKGWDNVFDKWEEFLHYIFFSYKWYPYPFFYRLEGARVLDEPSAMHGWEFQLTDP